jgi:hypothetical protein
VRPEERVMFEIYRETSYNMKYRVVYFTELGDHDKDKEISRALAGDHVFDGFLGSEHRREAKRAIAGLLERMNDGDALSGQQIESELEAFLA